MAGDPDSTRSTLLRRLRDWNDRQAWEEFLHRYGPRIYDWCRRYHLQSADAADVTQEVLIRLVTALRKFDYDPARGSFRGWLKTVTQNVIRDLAESWSRPGRGSGDSRVLRALQAHQAPEALASLAGEIEAEAERELVRQAHERVRLRVQPRTWQAYHQTAVERRPVLAVAQELGMPVAEVYVAKSRVLKLLRQEVERLNQQG